MTGNRGGNRPMRRDRLIQEYEHDTYKNRGKLPEPTVCKECGAVFQKGRWQWASRPDQAHETLCPACHRTHDRYPGGYLTLDGPFLAEHRAEILHRVRNVEEREKNQHPLRRIMAIEDGGEALTITTTDMQLARTLGEAVNDAYKGDLDYHYTEESNILRVNWRR
jgi:NMD protein affecting ribosome stability and mRNA decay